ncbi:hypothetical protein DS031_18170 [Bacillus taeanensis]|uniref:Uncharacterized protein n=1 Tax=Bacillus taeanensis TaxID=273032 RepID=A0A366XVI4_9BACI|nr:hypothetical protein DS031_18170 [Bacillus taeanensis]
MFIAVLACGMFFTHAFTFVHKHPYPHNKHRKMELLTDLCTLSTGFILVIHKKEGFMIIPSIKPM